MRFDVRLTAREPFQIRTSVVRGTARPDLRLTGTGLLPILRGPILFDAAQVALPSGTLEVERGTVLFRESDPGRPDARLRRPDAGAGATRSRPRSAGPSTSPEVILSSIPPCPRRSCCSSCSPARPRAARARAAAPSPRWRPRWPSTSARASSEQLLGGGLEAGGGGLQDRLELQVGRELTRSGSVTVDARLLLKKKLLGTRRRPVPHGREGHLRSGERRDEDPLQVQMSGRGRRCAGGCGPRRRRCSRRPRSARAPAARAATAVRIEGNAALSTRSLREAAAAELAGLEDPARRRAAAADAAFQMESAGHRAGYAFIEVEYAITGEGADAAVVFTVREGPLVRLGEVAFSGNAFFTAAAAAPARRAGGPDPVRGGRRPRRPEGPGAALSGPGLLRREDRGAADRAAPRPQRRRRALRDRRGDPLRDLGRGVRGGRAAGFQPGAPAAGVRPAGPAVLRAAQAGPGQQRDRGLRRAGLPGRRGRRCARSRGRRRATSCSASRSRAGRGCGSAGSTSPGTTRTRDELHPVPHPDQGRGTGSTRRRCTRVSGSSTARASSRASATRSRGKAPSASCGSRSRRPRPGRCPGRSAGAPTSSCAAASASATATSSAPGSAPGRRRAPR